MRRQYQQRSTAYKGREAAKKHIEEAHQLSQELGGTDRDVKQWFFNLSPQELEKIFVSYTRENGTDAGSYARLTFNDWRTGKRQMSGIVAARLFNLLPLVMPIDAKFQLVDSLWNHVAPTKKRVITAGVTTPIDEIIHAVTKEVSELTANWDIPSSMQNRFKWLAHEDSVTYQKLLQHIKDSEKKLEEKILKDQIPILKLKFETDLLESTSRLSYIIEVGKQSVELRLIKNIITLSAGDWMPEINVPSQRTSSNGGVPMWIWIVGLIALLIFLFRK